ncbi:phage holin family protein [Glycomyces xiaoerkulensis]|uniref:phage holin family protein n=1 Tax=Glycomyces xiaoerkulensis TaxID=2038139 RepID=UPI000C25A142|nr:phage holin family protein [Glycomyces xiaoerkulensis]
MEVRSDPEGMTFTGADGDTATRRRAWDDRDHSVGHLVGDLSNQVAHLARVEARLASREVAEKAKRGAVGGSLLAVAGALAFYGGAALAGAGVIALAMVWPAWLAALVGGAGLLVLGGIVALVAWPKVRRAVPPVPDETLERARDDVRAMEGRMEP